MDSCTVRLVSLSFHVVSSPLSAQELSVVMWCWGKREGERRREAGRGGGLL